MPKEYKLSHFTRPAVEQSQEIDGFTETIQKVLLCEGRLNPQQETRFFITGHPETGEDSPLVEPKTAEKDRLW